MQCSKTWSALNAHTYGGYSFTMAPREHISYWTSTHCSSPSTTENSPTSYFCSTIFQDLNRQQLELTYWSHGHTSVGTHEAFAFFVFHVIFEIVKVTGSGFRDPTTYDRMRQMNIPWECEVLAGSILQSISPLPSNQHTCLDFSTSENLLRQTHKQKWEVCSDRHIWYLQAKPQPMRVLFVTSETCKANTNRYKDCMERSICKLQGIKQSL